jgi:hypothetical protein
MDYNPRVGFILLFEGDRRRVNVSVDNVTTFSAVSGVLKQGDTDLTSTYVSDSPDKIGNLLLSGLIGGAIAPIVAGNYRYYLSGTYAGKKRTWYWDILVLPKDITFLSEVSLDDYDPFLDEIVTYEGDNFVHQFVFPGLDFSTATGVLKLLTEDVTATYCNSAVSVSGGTITTHNIGGVTSLAPGDYGYFISGTYNESDAVATWYLKVKVLPKASVL